MKKNETNSMAFIIQAEFTYFMGGHEGFDRKASLYTVDKKLYILDLKNKEDDQLLQIELEKSDPLFFSFNVTGATNKQYYMYAKNNGDFTDLKNKLNPELIFTT